MRSEAKPSELGLNSGNGLGSLIRRLAPRPAAPRRRQHYSISRRIAWGQGGDGTEGNTGKDIMCGRFSFKQPVEAIRAHFGFDNTPDLMLGNFAPSQEVPVI